MEISNIISYSIYICTEKKRLCHSLLELFSNGKLEITHKQQTQAYKMSCICNSRLLTKEEEEDEDSGSSCFDGPHPWKTSKATKTIRKRLRHKLSMFCVVQQISLCIVNMLLTKKTIAQGNCCLLTVNPLHMYARDRYLEWSLLIFWRDKTRKHSFVLRWPRSMAVFSP
jgi:hypothetical protein